MAETQEKTGGRGRPMRSTRGSDKTSQPSIHTPMKASARGPSGNA